MGQVERKFLCTRVEASQKDARKFFSVWEDCGASKGVCVHCAELLVALRVSCSVKNRDRNMVLAARCLAIRW